MREPTFQLPLLRNLSQEEAETLTATAEGLVESAKKATEEAAKELAEAGAEASVAVLRGANPGEFVVVIVLLLPPLAQWCARGC